MPHLDIRALVKAEHDALKADREEATRAVSQLHQWAEKTERDGNPGAAEGMRTVAADVQRRSDRRWSVNN